MTTKIPPNEKLNILSKVVVQRVEDLFKDLDVDVELNGNKYIGSCPIHGGDNKAAFNLYYDGYSVPGFWKCRTWQCENVFKKNIIGFARGRLSRMRLGYNPKSGVSNVYSFHNTVKYLCDFTGMSLDSIKLDQNDIARRHFIAEVNKQTKSFEVKNTGISRRRARNNLILPANYYVERGYSERILDLYDVGVAKVSKVDTKNRIIVPLYDENQFLIGYTARSMYERCQTCKLFHEGEAPCPSSKEDQLLSSKWRNIGFDSGKVLYNYHNAMPHIKDSHTVILVEGPGDVWRLEEAGIHNSVAMLGVNLSEAQENLLAQTQAMTIIVLTDEDEAGRKAAENINKSLRRFYRLYFPNISSHDVGDLNTNTITNELMPIIKRIKNLYE